MIVDGEKFFELIADDAISYDNEEPVYELTLPQCRKLLRKCEVNIQSPDRIEAAIRYLRKEYGRDKSDVWNDWELANAIAWASGLPQEENKGSIYPGLWTDKDLGLEEEK